MASTSLPPPEHETILDVLDWRASAFPFATAVTCISEEGSDHLLTYGQLWRQTRIVARALTERSLQGAPILTTINDSRYAAPYFLGCLQAGAIPVPVINPGWVRPGRVDGLWGSYLDAIDPLAILVDEELQQPVQSLLHRIRPNLVNNVIDVSPTDENTDDQQYLLTRPDHNPSSHSLAYLQMTSGTTGAPRGVSVSHQNVIEHCKAVSERMLPQEDSLALSWLPVYHDLGLFAGILMPIYTGVPVVLLSPLHFLRRPIAWLEAVSSKRATVTAAPNFAYDLVAKRASADDISGLDLSCLRVAAVGGETVRGETLRQFAETFRRAGFDATALSPGYGLAEATLAVSSTHASSGPTSIVVNAASLRQGAVSIRQGPMSTLDVGVKDRADTEIVSSGIPLPGTSVTTVRLNSDIRASPEEVGELVLNGPTVTLGLYSSQVRHFESWPPGPLRTGDLGFVCAGQVFVVGRLKDIILIHGVNYDPIEIEHVAIAACPGLRAGAVAAIARKSSTGIESVALLGELRQVEQQNQDYFAETASQIRRAVGQDVGVSLRSVAFFVPDSLPKTTSGKLCRQEAAAQLSSGVLRPIFTSDIPEWSERRVVPAGPEPV